MTLCERRNPSQKKEQDPIIEWLWESYQLSSELYAEVEKPGGNMITDAYYRKYLPVIQQRLQQAYHGCFLMFCVEKNRL